MLRLGIDKLPLGQPASASAQVNALVPVVCGAESEQQHGQHLVTALEQIHINCWPYIGQVALEEQGDSLRQYHVIDN